MLVILNCLKKILLHNEILSSAARKKLRNRIYYNKLLTNNKSQMHELNAILLDKSPICTFLFCFPSIITLAFHLYVNSYMITKLYYIDIFLFVNGFSKKQV